MKTTIYLFFVSVAICVISASVGFAQESFEYPETVSVTNIQIENGTLTGDFQNIGNMPIRSAEITVFFMDENNEPIDKTEISLIQPGDGALLPGETREFSQESGIPQGWSQDTGSLVVRATELDFAPRKQRRQENLGQQNGGTQQGQQRTREPDQCPASGNRSPEEQQPGNSSPAPGGTGPITDEPLPQTEPDPPLIEPGEDFPTAPGEEPQY